MKTLASMRARAPLGNAESAATGTGLEFSEVRVLGNSLQGFEVEVNAAPEVVEGAKRAADALFFAYLRKLFPFQAEQFLVPASEARAGARWDLGDSR